MVVWIKVVHFRPWSHKEGPLHYLGGGAEKAQNLQSASSFLLQSGAGLHLTQCPFIASGPVIMGKTKAENFLRPAIKQVGDRAEFVSQSYSKRKTIYI